MVAKSIAAILLAIIGLALGLYACGLRFKEMLATLTFLNEASIDSGAQIMQNAKNKSHVLGRKSLSLANHIASLRSQNKEPFQGDRKPWKTRSDHAPLEYEDLTNISPNLAAMNETDMKNIPEFLSRNNDDEAGRLGGTRNKVYNPLKARTQQFFSKIISNLSAPKADSGNINMHRHIEPNFNPHAFEPIRNAQTGAHIPALNQDVQTHYQQQVADPYKINMAPQLNPAPQTNPASLTNNVRSEVVGMPEMGDFYDGPNSYEDYWADSAPTQDRRFAPDMQMPAIRAHDAAQAHAAPYIQPFAPNVAQNVAPNAAPETYFETPYQTTEFTTPPHYEAAPAHAEETAYNDMPAFNGAPQNFAQPAAPQYAPQQAAPLAAQPFIAEPAPVAPAAPVAAAPIAAAPIAAAPIAAAPTTVIEPAEPAPTPHVQPFDLSAPQVNVRKGRKVSQAGTGFNHGGPSADDYELPSIDLLSMPISSDLDNKVSEKILAANARILENVLAEFRISGEIMNVRPGPVVTLYELEPAPGVKSARVIGLADDIARSMSAISARIAVIPGRNIIGIELPNEHRDTVYLNEIISSEEFKGNKLKLPMALGKSIDGTPVVADLARMPHLLIAGTTGSGKSVGINSMILSILYKMPPDKCKLILVDPKMLELSVYDGIPHLLTPVVTDPKKAIVALKWSVREMENRYKKMAKMGVRNIEGYNQRIKAAADKGEPLVRTVQTGFDHKTGKPVYEHEALEYEEMPFIVIVIDEMADLMMVAGKEIEGVIQRLAQMARAAGIHMITATQRPSVDVITGSIKANFPTRISFQVTSKIDSRTILNEMGAEQLLGQGDMLHMAGGGRINRVHGAFVADEEVESVVNHLKRQGVPEYIEDITVDVEGETEVAAPDGGPAPTTDENGEALDLYDQAVAIVARDQKASTSYIQRKLSIGYNRAATIIERMEEDGVIGAANHAGKREILVGNNDEF
ncbi:MAG: cell division protein FtsK [Hyphomicrobiales bacterium]|nr:MAG: cell division protein FtsK [Hyphomicrobiales bacterium]